MVDKTLDVANDAVGRAVDAAEQLVDKAKDKLGGSKKSG